MLLTKNTLLFQNYKKKYNKNFKNTLKNYFSKKFKKLYVNIKKIKNKQKTFLGCGEEMSQPDENDESTDENEQVMMS